MECEAGSLRLAIKPTCFGLIEEEGRAKGPKRGKEGKRGVRDFPLSARGLKALRSRSQGSDSLSLSLDSLPALSASHSLEPTDSNSTAYKHKLTPHASRSARMSSRSATSGMRRSGAEEVEGTRVDASISAAMTFSSAASARARDEVGRPWPRETAEGASARPLRGVVGFFFFFFFFPSEKFFQRKGVRGKESRVKCAYQKR